MLVPVGTAAASHLFGGAARPRALGVIGALTFLGMAAGPVVGAAILASVHPEDALAVGRRDAARRSRPSSRPPGAGCSTSTSRSGSSRSSWPGLPSPAGRRRAGAAGWTSSGPRWYGLALVAGLLGLTLLGSPEIAGTDARPGRRDRRPARRSRSSRPSSAVVRGLRVDDPFLDPRLFRSVPFCSAALVSLLTGYGFATAIIGGAVFVDRVLYGGPDEQRLALGALAGATALGALAVGLRRPGPAAAARRPGRARAEHRRAARDVALDARVEPRRPSRSPSASSGSGSG